jgi:hypothetical protein
MIGGAGLVVQTDKEEGWLRAFRGHLLRGCRKRARRLRQRAGALQKFKRSSQIAWREIGKYSVHEWHEWHEWLWDPPLAW